jgi:hypothetical protein
MAVEAGLNERDLTTYVQTWLSDQRLWRAYISGQRALAGRGMDAAGVIAELAKGSSRALPTARARVRIAEPGAVRTAAGVAVAADEVAQAGPNELPGRDARTREPFPWPRRKGSDGSLRRARRRAGPAPELTPEPA